MEAWRKELYASTTYLAHHGIKGQKWDVRRFQNEDGSLTPEGRARYGVDDRNMSFAKQQMYTNRYRNDMRKANRTDIQRGNILTPEQEARRKSDAQTMATFNKSKVSKGKIIVGGLMATAAIAAAGYGAYKFGSKLRSDAVDYGSAWLHMFLDSGHSEIEYNNSYRGRRATKAFNAANNIIKATPYVTAGLGAAAAGITSAKVYSVDRAKRKMKKETYSSFANTKKGYI